MAGEQDMRRMGALRGYMPVTYITMLVGTLAIAGIPPLAGFFSKDEILYRTFLGNRLLWGLALVTALMTAFYMFRLMSMTFLGSYRGPAFARRHGAHEVPPHGTTHPADPHAHGQAGRPDHEVTHGPAHGDDAHGHGHGPWHGPHEAPRAMTLPLMILAVGAIVAGFVGIPAALGGNNAIEHFLQPSFSAPAGSAVAPAVTPGQPEHGEPGLKPGSTEHLSHTAEIGLMLLSVAIAVGGIWLAYRLYVARPAASEALARRWSGLHGVLSNKYYVDELYDATVVKGTMAGARGLWTVDSRVVDGAVNGSGWITQFTAWVSHMIDKYIVDGLVNLIGWTAGESSLVFRRIQTGLVQNYALLMLFGVFAFVSLYLFMR